MDITKLTEHDLFSFPMGAGSQFSRDQIEEEIQRRENPVLSAFHKVDDAKLTLAVLTYPSDTITGRAARSIARLRVACALARQ